MEKRLTTVEDAESEIKKALDELAQLKIAAEEKAIAAKKSVDAILVHFDEYSSVVKTLPMEDSLKKVIMTKQLDCRAKILSEYEVLDRRLAAIVGASQVLSQVQAAIDAKERLLREEEAAQKVAKEKVEKLEQKILDGSVDMSSKRQFGERPESLRHLRHAQANIEARQDLQGEEE